MSKFSLILLFQHFFVSINLEYKFSIINNYLNYHNEYWLFIFFVTFIVALILMIKWIVKRSIVKIQQEKSVIEKKNFQLTKELHDKESWLKSILNSLNESMVVVYNRDGVYLNAWAPPELEKRYGVRSADLVGMSAANQFPPTEAKTFLSLIQTVYTNAKPKFGSYIFHCPGGKFWHDVSLKPMRNSSGKITAVIGFIRDITEQKSSLQKIEEIENKYRSIVEILTDGVVFCDEDGIIGEWNKAMVDITGLTSEDMIGLSVWDAMYKITPLEKRNPEFLQRYKAKTFQLLNSDNVFSKGKVSEYIIETIDGGRKSINVFYSTIKTDSGTRALQIIRDISECKQVEENLRESEETYRSLIEHSNDAIYLLYQGKFVIINKKFEEMFGYSREETNAPNFDFMNLVAPNSKAYVAERARKLAKGEELILPLRYEFTALTRAGNKVEAEVAVTYVNYKGVIATQGILRDITDRKRAEERAKFIANLLQNSKVTIIGINNDRRFIIWNRGAEELLGWKAEEIIGKPGSIIVPDEHRQQIDQIINQKLKNGGAVEFETERFCKDGRRVNVFFTASIIADAEDQIIGYLGVLVNITERKKAELALQESEEKYRTLIEQSNDAIYLLYQDKFIIINKKFQEILGYSPQEVRAPDFNILNLVSPKSRALVEERRLKLLKGIQLKTRYEFSGLTKSGQEIEFEVAVSYVKYNGKIAIQGVLRDITERKQMEQALRDSEAYFHSLFENVKDAIFVESINGKILDVNRAATKLLGYSHGELTRMHVKDIISPELVKLLPEIVKLHKSGKVLSSQQTENIHKKGHKIPVEVSTNIVNIYDKPHVIAVIRDITEQQKAEKEKIDAIRQTVSALAKAVAERDPYTPSHSANVAKISMLIARRMGWNDDRILGLRLAGELHDIGKIGVPAEILAKPARLNELEYTIIREHVQKGYEILKDIKFPFPVAKAVYQSHELLDGSGYPQKLKGEEIIMEARILKVADILEAFTTPRPYRPSFSLNTALEKLSRDAGILYDKDVVHTVFQLIDEAGGKSFWE